MPKNSIESLSELITLLNRYDKAPPKGQTKLAIRIQEKIDSLDPNVQDNLNSISSNLQPETKLILERNCRSLRN